MNSSTSFYVFFLIVELIWNRYTIVLALLYLNILLMGTILITVHLARHRSNITPYKDVNMFKHPSKIPSTQFLLLNIFEGKVEKN